MSRIETKTKSPTRIMRIIWNSFWKIPWFQDHILASHLNKIPHLDTQRWFQSSWDIVLKILLTTCNKYLEVQSQKPRVKSSIYYSGRKYSIIFFLWKKWTENRWIFCTKSDKLFNIKQENEVWEKSRTCNTFRSLQAH